MIPDAAVEAGLSVLGGWEENLDADFMRALLEAAAPHMLAQFHAPTRKPLAGNALFETLRGLHPSSALLRDIVAVDLATRDKRAESRG